MSGTKAGGMKAAKTVKEKYGTEFYGLIGAKGGRLGHTGGFAADPERAKRAGKIGGLKSRRNGIKNGQGREKVYHKVWGE